VLIDPQLLLQVPGCEAGQAPLHLRPLPGGGGAHQVLDIRTRAGRFVLRRALRVAPAPGTDRHREWACQARAAAAGLAPAVVAADPQQGWLLMQWCAGSTWSAADLQDGIRLQRLGERLRVLHGLAPPAAAPLDLAGIGQAYVQTLSATAAPARRVEVHHHAQALQPLHHELTRAGAMLQRPLSVVHGDLGAGNLVGDAPWLIDWEYAQLADPLYDIACLLSCQPLTGTQLAVLREAAGLADPALDGLLARYRQVFVHLNALWAG
jgi:thiamine kinase